LGNVSFTLCWAGIFSTLQYLNFDEQIMNKTIRLLFHCHGNEKQVERDPTPLYHAAKELINMQLDSGEFPQQVSLQFFYTQTFYFHQIKYLLPFYKLNYHVHKKLACSQYK
jgi:hypothetical protein